MVGILAVVTSIVGFIIGARVGCFFGIYLTFGALLCLAQAGMVGYLFFAPEDTVNKLADYDKFKDPAAK